MKNITLHIKEDKVRKTVIPFRKTVVLLIITRLLKVWPQTVSSPPHISASTINSGTRPLHTLFKIRKSDTALFSSFVNSD